MAQVLAGNEKGHDLIHDDDYDRISSTGQMLRSATGLPGRMENVPGFLSAFFSAARSAPW